jgi:uncharacterized protein
MATDLVGALLDPGAYPADERPAAVTMAETHISWLFFAGDFVYKVKKPVDYGFLDFTTLALRRRFCDDEVRLNRRLSPDIYLGVATIRERDGRYRLEGEGRPVEYAVRMRRLPPDRWLSDLLDRGEADPGLMRRIAARVAAFHRDAATDDRITAVGGLAAVRGNTAENFAQTESYVGVTLTRALHDRVAAWTAAFLAEREPVFRRREAEGRIRDCHGDLHADQISITDGIAFIDCIEFNERFRFGDVAADIAFTAMDVEYHGAPVLARELIEAYVREADDPGVLGVMSFYQCYRAFTRGKVRSFRLRQPGLSDADRRAVIDQAGRYFALAGRYARPERPALLVLTGLMGSGKSSLAGALAERLPASVFSSDVVRKELLGLDPEVPRPERWGAGIYGEAATRRTYDELHRRARTDLGQGRSVILDASYRDAAWRHEARALARATGADFLLVEARCSEPLVRARLAGRQGGPSDGRVELLAAQEARYEPPTEVPASQRLVVDTAPPLEQVARSALEEVERRLLAGYSG